MAANDPNWAEILTGPYPMFAALVARMRVALGENETVGSASVSSS